MNARFWAWIPHCDSWVKLTLRPGQSLSYHHGQRHCEGWSSWAVRWTLGHDGVVTRESISNGRDCDGRLYYAADDYCRMAELRADVGHDGTRIPAWLAAGSEYSDEYAEMMGY